MEAKKLQDVLNLHKKWLVGEKDGIKANLSWANLSWADLSSADLSWANLSWANLSSADLSWANLSWANLRSADLSSADLSWANLSWANLRSADLSSANLRSADLGSADLGSADLSDAKIPENILNILSSQRGRVVAFKLVNAKYHSPYQTSESPYYKIDSEVHTDEFDSDKRILCGKGINIATLDWCKNNRKTGWRILQVSFVVKSEDDICVPYASDGKFRVKAIKVEREVK